MEMFFKETHDTFDEFNLKFRRECRLEVADSYEKHFQSIARVPHSVFELLNQTLTKWIRVDQFLVWSNADETFLLFFF